MNLLYKNRAFTRWWFQSFFSTFSTPFRKWFSSIFTSTWLKTTKSSAAKKGSFRLRWTVDMAKRRGWTTLVGCFVFFFHSFSPKNRRNVGQVVVQVMIFVLILGLIFICGFGWWVRFWQIVFLHVKSADRQTCVTSFEKSGTCDIRWRQKKLDQGSALTCTDWTSVPGVDVLTRAFSWLLSCGMQGLPGRAQVILMGHGELLG